MTFSKNQKFEKLGLFIEKSVQKHPRNNDAEIIENIRNSMPKWSQNPSKIHQKSIQKSRSEKERPKIDKNRHQILTFFWDASWKASWKVLGAKTVPKPSKITPKMIPKEANRALQKGKDFNRGKQLKKQRKTTS